MVWEKQRIYYLVVTMATIMSVWGGRFDVASTANLLVIDYALHKPPIRIHVTYMLASKSI